MGKWADLADRIQTRDQYAIDEMNRMFDGVVPIESHLMLAEGRAMDALAAVLRILRHLDEQEQVHNAELRGASQLAGAASRLNAELGEED